VAAHCPIIASTFLLSLPQKQTRSTSRSGNLFHDDILNLSYFRDFTSSLFSHNFVLQTNTADNAGTVKSVTDKQKRKLCFSKRFIAFQY